MPSYSEPTNPETLWLDKAFKEIPPQEVKYLRKSIYIVVPVGLAAGVVLPYLVLHSDDISKKFSKRVESREPEVSVKAREVKIQELPRPKPRALVLADDATAPKPSFGYRPRRKHGVRRVQRLTDRSMQLVRDEDREAFRSAERLLQVERIGRP